MKFASYMEENQVKVGIVSKDEKKIYNIKEFGFDFKDMNETIEMITSKDMEYIKNTIEKNEVKKSYLKDIELLSPIVCPKQDIICLGINYLEHAKESADFTKIKYSDKKEVPVYFSKRVNEAVSPFGNIDGHLDIVKDLDYEVELAFILKKDAKNIKAKDALDYIFGYTIMNDVSARTFQKQHEQWYRGKSLDGFTPMGPWIVTTDEFEFPPKLKIQCKVNDEIRQDSNTDCLVFGIPYILEELSRGMTLKSGTIIATGTPSGVAMGMKNPKYLNKDDKVECYIEGIGSLINIVK